MRFEDANELMAPGNDSDLIERLPGDVVRVQIVDRLEAAGYCGRRANPADRRSSIIELTAPGVRLLAQLTQTVQDELERRLGPARPGVSLAGLTRSLTQLRSAVRATGTPDTSDAPGAIEQATR